MYEIDWNVRTTQEFPSLRASKNVFVTFTNMNDVQMQKK